MTDDALERSLRELFASRDPGPAPERLFPRVAQAPVRAHRGPGFPLQALASLAAAIVLVAVGLAIVGRPIVDPRAGVGDGWQPGSLSPGVGLAVPGVPVLPVALLLVLVILGVALLRHVPTVRHRAVVAAATLMLGYGYVVAGSPSPVDGYPSSLGVFVFGADPAIARPVYDSDGAPTNRYRLRLRPGEVYRFLVSVRNDTGGPLTILGLEPQEDPRQPIPRLVGLGMAADPNDITFEGARPFTATTLAPGDYVTLVVLGDAGPCATPRITESQMVLDSITLVTRVAGWERPTTVPLGSEAASVANELAIALDADCLGARQPDPS